MPETYYTRPIEMPTTRKEGLANFVQLIINRLEAGDAREALLTAVDLRNDLEGTVYDGAAESNGPATILLSEHDAQMATVKAEAYRKGFAAGEAAKAKAVRAVIGSDL